MAPLRTTLLSLVLLLAGLALHSQPMLLGEKALNEGDYYRAQEHFNRIIEDASSVQPFDLALAYYYRSWTWIKLYGEGPADVTSVLSDPSGQMLLNAYDDLLSALAHEDGRLTKRINDLLVQLEPGLLQYGLVMINRAEDQQAAGKPFKSTAEEAIRYLEPATRINNSYLAYDLLGQAFLMTEKKDRAIEMFERSVGTYSNRTPETPDFMIGYAYFRLAVLYRDHLMDVNGCLDIVHTGRKVLDEEYSRWMKTLPAGQGSSNTRPREEYLRASQDLHTLELETLLRSPDKLSEAQAVFRSELARKPDDVNLMIAYASLFEKTDPEVAVAYYKKAMQQDPGNPIAGFNLAVVYYNQGQKFFNEGVRTEDEDKQDLNISRAQEYFKLARPLFEKVLQGSPADPQAISALKLICFAMDDLEGYEFYQELEKKSQ